MRGNQAGYDKSSVQSRQLLKQNVEKGPHLVHVSCMIILHFSPGIVTRKQGVNGATLLQVGVGDDTLFRQNKVSKTKPDQPLVQERDKPF